MVLFQEVRIVRDDSNALLYGQWRAVLSLNQLHCCIRGNINGVLTSINIYQYVHTTRREFYIINRLEPYRIDWMQIDNTWFPFPIYKLHSSLYGNQIAFDHNDKTEMTFVNDIFRHVKLSDSSSQGSFWGIHKHEPRRYSDLVQGGSHAPPRRSETPPSVRSAALLYSTHCSPLSFLA